MKTVIKTSQKKCLSILMFSDFHIHSCSDVDRCIKYVSRFKGYDVVVVVGDIFDSVEILRDELLVNKAVKLFMILSKIAPLYFVSGNHDVTTYTRKGSRIDNVSFKSRFLNKLQGEKNIHFLENETVVLDSGYTISGLIPNSISTLEEGKYNYDFLQKLDSKKTNILLCHYPSLIFDLEKRGCLNDVHLCLSGHNHNGATQFRFFPVEKILDLLGQKNRGIITPSKSVKFKDTKFLRGIVNFSDKRVHIINPAYKTLSHCSGCFSLFDWMFYRGFTEIVLEPDGRENVKK